MVAWYSGELLPFVHDESLVYLLHLRLHLDLYSELYHTTPLQHSPLQHSSNMSWQGTLHSHHMPRCLPRAASYDEIHLLLPT